MSEAGVKIAVVGAGRWGANVAREAASTGGLAAIVSRDPLAASVQELSNTYQVPALTLSELCARTDIPAAWIATPIATHEEIATRLLDAGKHVLVEKPATGNAAAARSLAERAARAGLTFATGYVFLYHPAVQELAKRLAPRSVQRATFTWEKYGTFSEPIDLNLFTHHVSIALALFGNPKGGSVKIAENGNRLFAEIAYDTFSVASDVNRESEKSKMHVLDFHLADGSQYRINGQQLLRRDTKEVDFVSVFDSDESALGNEVRAFVHAVETGDASSLPSAKDFAARVHETFAKLEA